MAAARLGDIARELGLDVSTVSRALRGDRRVAAETRARAGAAAARLGYRPHLGARALAEGRTRSVWFVIPGLENPIEREPAAHAARWLLERDYDLLIAQHYDDPEVYGRVLDRLANGGADGAIIIPSSKTRSGKADRGLEGAGIPYVYLDRRVAGIEAPVVTSDNGLAAASLLRVLAAGPACGRGEAAPGWALDGFAPEANEVESARSSGLRKAARALGLKVLAGPMPGSGGLPCRPCAVLASSREAALSAASMASTAGYRGDYIAAVFDAWEGPAIGFSRIVVAMQDFKAMGEAAAEIVYRGLSEGGARRARELRLPLLGIREGLSASSP